MNMFMPNFCLVKVNFQNRSLDLFPFPNRVKSGTWLQIVFIGIVYI